MKALAAIAALLMLLAGSDTVRAQSCACLTTDKTSTCCALKSSIQACIACAVGKGNPREGATGWCQRNQPACRR